MNKNETIIEIINIYDENQRLKMENERLKEGVKCTVVSNEKTNLSNEKQHLSNAQLVFIQEGEKTLMSKCVRSYASISVSEDDNGNKTVTTFERWLRDAIYKDYIPSSLSYDEFIQALYDDLKKEYEAKVKEALEDE